MTLLQLTTKRDSARKTLAKAKTDEARAKAAAELETASAELAVAQAKLGVSASASEVGAKTMRLVKREKTEEYEEDDGEEEEEEEEESEEEEETSDSASDDDDSGDDDGDDGDDDSGDDDESEEEEEDEDEDDGDDDGDDEEEEKARAAALTSTRSLIKSARASKDPKAIKVAKAHARAVKSALALSGRARGQYRQLAKAVSAATGKRGLSAMIGAVEGLAAKAKTETKNAKAIAEMRAEARRTQVSSMLKSARRDGKIVEAQVEHLRAQGLSDPKWLKAYLAVLPKAVRSVEGGGRTPKTIDGQPENEHTARTPAARDAALTVQGLTEEQRKYIASSAAASGKTIEEYVDAMNAKSKALIAPTNGAGAPQR